MARVSPGTPDWAVPLNQDLTTIEALAQAALNEVNGRLSAESISSQIARATSYNPRLSLSGPATTDSPTIALGVAADAAWDEAYTTTELAQVVDAFGPMSLVSDNWSCRTSDPNAATVTTYRFMTDGDAFCLFTYASGFSIDLFVDGRPYDGNHILPAATTGYAPYGFQTFTFASAKPRLIELRMIGGMAGLYVKKPYRVWKPTPDLNPSIAVVGDSYVAPSVMNDAASGYVSDALYLRGIYQRMPASLGVSELVTDGIGGTGYVAPSNSDRPYGHSERIAWLESVQPDVVIVHGGGANDLYNNFPVNDITDAVVAYFTQVRGVLPNAKLVFVEGFAPPLAGFAENNPDYITIRTNAQAALTDSGIGAYYLGVASEPVPAITGTGYVTAPTGVGNSDIYVGSDAVHLTVRGNTYVRELLAPKVARVLADDGTLLDTLI